MKKAFLLCVNFLFVACGTYVQSVSANESRVSDTMSERMTSLQQKAADCGIKVETPLGVAALALGGCCLSFGIYKVFQGSYGAVRMATGLGFLAAAYSLIVQPEETGRIVVKTVSTAWNKCKEISNE